MAPRSLGRAIGSETVHVHTCAVHAGAKKVRVVEWAEQSCLICTLWVIPIEYSNHVWFNMVFLKLTLEQIHFVAATLSALTTVPFLSPGRKYLQFLGSVYWFLPSRNGANFRLCVRPLLSGFFFFLAAAFEKTNSIELYTLYISGPWVYYLSNTVQLVLKYFPLLFGGLYSHGRKNSMKFWRFQFPLPMCR